MQKHLSVSLILPTFNERDNIVPLIQEIDHIVRSPKEIIVVDDNSPDGTSQAVAAYIKRKKSTNIHIETRTRNRGLTNSLWHGIQKAHGNIIIWMDSDFSMPPTVILQLLTKVEEGFDIAIGSRFVQGGRAKPMAKGPKDAPFLIFLSRVLNVSMRLLFGMNIYDYTSGFIAAKRDVFNHIALRGDYGEYCIDFLVRAASMSYRIVEIPYSCQPRRFGESKTGSHIWQYLYRGRTYISTIWRLYRKIHHLPP